VKSHIREFNDSLRGDFPINDALAQAIQDLCYRGSSVFDTPPQIIYDQDRFDKENPDNPLASQNARVRQDAAEYLYRLALLARGHTRGELAGVSDDIRQSAAQHVYTLLPSILEHLHQAVFDRDAAVRMTVVETLAVFGEKESVPFLERLARSEDERMSNPDAVQEALRGCRAGCGRDIRFMV
jgi:hypothetical protein